jgi:hypothetical protein
MVLKPLSPATLKYKEQNSLNTPPDQPVSILPPAELVSPNNEKKKILLQESDIPLIPTVQRNRVLLPYSGNQSLTDTDDSDSNDSTISDVSTKQLPKFNRKLYYMIFGFLCWAAVQYWMIAVVGFGAVFFIVSALIAICLNTTNTDKKRNTLSAYSVFNPQCTPIHGSADPKQLERELIFGSL